MGRGREARPIEERGTLCEGRGRASGATGYRRVNGRVVAGFPFSGECSTEPGGKGAQGEEERPSNEWVWPLQMMSTN
jgi:hypothetical protein